MPDVHPDWKTVPDGGIGRPKPTVRRRGRVRATPAQWQVIAAAKTGPCRVCGSEQRIELHHLVRRSHGGDDVQANIVPLCTGCHRDVSMYEPIALELLEESLSVSEYTYCIGKLGEGALDRLFGVYRRETGERGA